MRSWWKSLGLLAGGLVTLGSLLSTASAQYPPPGMGMPPGGGMMGLPPGMGMPPGGGMMGPPPGMLMGNPGGGPPPGAFGGNPNMGGMPAEFPNPAQPSQEPASPFSIKDEGMPNAFTDRLDPRSNQAARAQFSLGYTVMWFKGSSYPPLLTSGSVNDPIPGAIGQPGTQVLDTGSRATGASSAFRTSLTYWLLDPEVFCLDANFFIMEQRSAVRSFSSNANGVPLLARPFFNVNTGTEDADPRSVPGASSGVTFDSIRTRLMGSEVNLKWYSNNMAEGPNVCVFAGIRWLRLDERYLSNDTTTDIGGGGVATSISDNFTTYNQFVGGQLGTEWMYRWGRANFGIMTKIAYGPNYQTLRISGQTTQTDIASGNVITDTQGLFAQPSNVGYYTAMAMTVLPEVGVKMNIDLSDRIRFHVGYTYFWMTNTVRASEQIDRRVSIQPLLSGGGFGAAAPPPPIFRTSVFDAHMINLAVEFIF